MLSFETIFLLFIMLVLAVGLRTVAEGQRIALFRFGRFLGIKGPGIVMVVPYIDRECKITIGDRGILMSDGTARFQEFQVPVTIYTNTPVGSSIKVVGFSKDGIRVA